MMNYSPQPCVMLVNEGGESFNRHGLSQGHYHSFKEERKTTTGTSPGDINQPDAALAAFYPGNMARQIRLMLKKIQVAPMLQLGIIRFKLFLSTFWARKGPATPEVDHDVNPFP